MEVIFLTVLILTFVVGIIYIRLTGGITKHIYFSYSLAVYTLFLIIPVYFYWKLEKFEELGVSIESVFATGVLYYAIAMIFFVLGYIMIPTASVNVPLFKKEIIFSNQWMFRVTAFFIILSLSVHFSGIDAAGSFITYIWTTLDFLITLTIALYIREVNKYIFSLLFFIVALIFAIYFFRYRIYLTIMGLGAIYVFNNPGIFSKIFRYMFLGSLMLYLVLFFTINKVSLTSLDFENTEFNIFKESAGQVSNQNILIEQGSNLHTDFTILKYFTDNSEAKHDYGSTMFIYPFVRALPSSLFVNGIKPYPAPAMQEIVNAYGGDNQAEQAGRFVTNIFEFYIAFGLSGIVVGMFFFGCILKVLQNRWTWDYSYNSIVQISIMVSLFQYISRGYFPQYINHISYLIAPVFLLRWLSLRFAPVDFTNSVEEIYAE